MFLLCVEVSICGFDEVFQFIVRHSYIFNERLSIVPAAPQMYTIQISLKYNSAVFLLFIQFSVAVHISVCPMGLAAVNWYMFIN